VLVLVLRLELLLELLLVELVELVELLWGVRVLHRG
jgi:hypothetical protein